MKSRKILSLVLALVMIISTFSMTFAETYTIKSGDVLWKIADQFDTDAKTIADYNNIKNPDMIYAGETLEIPGSSITAKGDKVVNIVGTADLHGRIYAYEYAIDSVDKDAGLAKIQSILLRERKADPNVLVMDVGDTIQDNSAELFNDMPVHPMVQALNEMDFDVWALGNHEFNFEKTLLDRNVAAFEGTVLSANIYEEATGERYVDGYKVFDIDGVKVAVIGMIPPNVPVWEAGVPSHFEGLTFTDVAEETAKAVAELEGQYDVLIGAYHLGPDGQYGYDGIEGIAEQFPQFDVIFGGHAHSKYTNEVNGVQLIEPGKYGWALAKTSIGLTETADGYEVSEVLTANLETYNESEDQGILDTFAYVHETSMTDANTVVGNVTSDYIENVDYITGDAKVTTMATSKVQDTALIDLINEVQKFYAGADISSAAAFKEDMNLTAGEFMKKDASNIYKYANTLMGINITGANLKAYMEWSAQFYNTYKPGDVTLSFNENVRGYNYDMYAGVTYDIDVSQPAGSRITNLEFNGDDIDDEAIYKLAVNNYRLGTLTSNGWATTDDVYYDSYDEMQDAGRIRDLIIKYIVEEKGGVITPTVDNNWSIIGANFDHPLKDEIFEMVKAGTISIPTSEDGRTYNVKPLNVFDLIEDGTLQGYTPISILHTNDMHGFFIEGKYNGMGAAKMATFINARKEANPNTLLLDAGDALHGDNLVTLSDGEAGTKVLNALGYDAMTAGNHEFDYGSEQTVKLAGMLDFPMLAANIKNEDGSLLLDDLVVLETAGVKVGVFGIATPETKYKSHPKNTVGLTFDDIYATSEAMVAQLQALDCDVIVALAHIGDEGDYTTEELATSVAGIDVIIDGHSHSTYPSGKMVGTTLIAAAGEKTKNVGIIELAIKDDMIADKGASLFTKADAVNTAEDATLAAVVNEIKVANEPITEEVVATSPVVLVGEKPLVRTGETNLGNLLAEALLQYSGADVALTNGGGIRASIDAGEVTKGEVLTVLPYGNQVRILEVTGAEIIAALEVGVDEYPEAKGAFPHIAGMTVKFDSTLAAGARVTEVLIDGVALDSTMTYTLATNDFVADSGDGYTMFTLDKVVGELGAMEEVLIDFMNEFGFDKAVEDGRIMDINDLQSALTFPMAA